MANLIKNIKLQFNKIFTGDVVKDVKVEENIPYLILVIISVIIILVGLFKGKKKIKPKKKTKKLNFKIKNIDTKNIKLSLIVFLILMFFLIGSNFKPTITGFATISGYNETNFSSINNLIKVSSEEIKTFTANTGEKIEIEKVVGRIKAEKISYLIIAGILILIFLKKDKKTSEKKGNEFSKLHHDV